MGLRGLHLLLLFPKLIVPGWTYHLPTSLVSHTAPVMIVTLTSRLKTCILTTKCYVNWWKKMVVLEVLLEEFVRNQKYFANLPILDLSQHSILVVLGHSCVLVSTWKFIQGLSPLPMKKTLMIYGENSYGIISLSGQNKGVHAKIYWWCQRFTSDNRIYICTRLWCTWPSYQRG